MATRIQAVIEIVIKPGDHSDSGSELAVVWSDNLISEDDQRRIVGAFIIGGQRTPLQDIRFQCQQLTDVIVRALSPAINDPFTAINGIDALASAASQLARRPRAPEGGYDSSETLRLIVSTPRVDEILRDTVGHIALYGAGNPFVMRSLRRVLQTVEPDLVGHGERAMLSKMREDLDRRCRDSEVG